MTNKESQPTFGLETLKNLPRTVFNLGRRAVAGYLERWDTILADACNGPEDE
jgi:hypothetical protein